MWWAELGRSVRAAGAAGPVPGRRRARAGGLRAMTADTPGFSGDPADVPFGGMETPEGEAPVDAPRSPVFPHVDPPFCASEQSADGDGRRAEWRDVLAHRPNLERGVVAQRFAAHGVTVEQVRRPLADAGAELDAAAAAGVPGWAEPLGGLMAVALIAGEVCAYARHRAAQAEAVRSAAVNELVEEYSTVTVAEHLGVSCQAVYEIARRSPLAGFIKRIWRRCDRTAA
jgi:hypothetical protein